MEWSKVMLTAFTSAGVHNLVSTITTELRNMCPEKLSGVYNTIWDIRQEYFLGGFDDIFYVPHSRNTDVDVEAVGACKDIKVVAESDEARNFCYKSNLTSRFYMGHSSMMLDRLEKLWERCKAGKILMYLTFYPDPGKEASGGLASCANLLFSNWLASPLRVSVDLMISIAFSRRRAGQLI